MWDDQAVRRQIERILDTVLPGHPDAEEIRALIAVADTGDGPAVLQALEDFYSDFGRAERAPRAVLYLHMGMLVGLARTAIYGPPQ